MLLQIFSYLHYGLLVRFLGAKKVIRKLEIFN